jgi:hypothetical protein
MPRSKKSDDAGSGAVTTARTPQNPCQGAHRTGRSHLSWSCGNKVSSGPNAPSDKLRYVYKQGGNTGEMAGEIVARTPGERLHCKYFDSMFDVSVDLRVNAASEGALTTHVIEITPKRFFAKLMSPLIRLGLGKQTRDAAANLKKLLESTTTSQSPK